VNAIEPAAATREPAIGEQWRRLHPLSPVVRFGRMLVAIVVIAVPSLEYSRPRPSSGWLNPSLAVYLGLLMVGAIAGVISWLVTRWRIDGGDLRIETGLIRRQSFRIPLARIQAVDIVAPLAARVLGLAEVRVVSAGRGAERGRLAYLTATEAPQVRARLLALAHGLAAETPEPPAVPLLHVSNGLLIPALSMRAAVAWPLLLAVGAIVVVAVSPAIGAALFGSGATVLVLGVFSVFRAFNEDFDFSVSEAGDGVRLDRGLLQRRHETIPYGRIQAVRLVQPLLWRLFGWSRLEVDVARQHMSREGDPQAQQVARTLLPVASRDQALWLLARVMPHAGVAPAPGSAPPPRARFKAPLSFHLLRAWYGHHYVYARTGRVQAATMVVPMVKVQSVRFTSGPLQRAFGLASVHIDTAGRRWQASARCRDEREAQTMLWEISDRARAARAAAR
jgi:putative membrane protein